MKTYKAWVNGAKEPLRIEAMHHTRHDQETYFFDDKGDIVLCIPNHNLICWRVEDKEEEVVKGLDGNIYYLFIFKDRTYHIYKNVVLQRKRDMVLLKKAGLPDIDCAKHFNENIAYMFEINIKDETIFPIFKDSHYGL